MMHRGVLPQEERHKVHADLRLSLSGALCAARPGIDRPAEPVRSRGVLGHSRRSPTEAAFAGTGSTKNQRPYQDPRCGGENVALDRGSHINAGHEQRPSRAATRSACQTPRLGRRLFVRLQDRIDPRLPTGPLRPKPSEHLRVDSQGDGFLRRGLLESPPDDTANNVGRVGLRMAALDLDVTVLLRSHSRPISSRCSRSRSCAHASSPFSWR